MMKRNAPLPAWRAGADGIGRVDIKRVWQIALPLMVTNAIQSGLNLTDTWLE
jgi:Na+-driven multidrug efflux pump